MKTFKEKRKERKKKRQMRERTRNTVWEILIEGAELVFDVFVYVVFGIIRLFFRIFE